MITTTTQAICWMGSNVPPISVSIVLPVLLNEELQCLSVGEHHIWIYTEVVVACGVLAAKIPNEIRNTDRTEEVVIIQSRPDYSQLNAWM